MGKLSLSEILKEKTNNTDFNTKVDDIDAKMNDKIVGHIGVGGTTQHPLGNGSTAGFSTNDFTVALKSKLDGIAANANNYTYTHLTTDGNLHVPATGTTNNGKVLKAGAIAGSSYWGTLTTADVDAAPSGHVGAKGTTQHGLADGTNAGFSTNDFTTALRDKLNNIQAGATTVTITNNLTASTSGTALDAAQGKALNDNKANLASPTFTGTPAAPTATAGTNTTQLATTAFVQAAKTTITNNLTTSTTGTALDATQGKVLNDKVVGHIGVGGTAQHPLGNGTTAGFSTNDFTATLKTKLDGIAAGANNYSHSTGDGNLHVPATGTSNNGKVLTAGSTAGSLIWKDLPTKLPADGGSADTAKDAEKLGGKTLEELQSSLLTSGSGGVQGDSYVNSGLELRGGKDGLKLTVTKGSCVINNEGFELTTDKVTTLDARMTSLVGLKKDGSISKLNAVFPAADTNTVARWDFSTKSLNDTSGKGNNLTCYGNNAVMTPTASSNYWKWVDGYTGYGLQSDGATANTYLINESAASFPTGNTEREIRCVWTYEKPTPNIGIIAEAGVSGNSQMFGLAVMPTHKLKFYGYNLDYDINYTLVLSETYFFVINFDGRIIRLYINGKEVWQKSAILYTGTANGYFEMNRVHKNGGYYCGGTWHYVEFKNKITSPEKVSEIANKALFLSNYYKFIPSYPGFNEAGSIELRFDEISGTTATDTMGTRNGLVIGEVPIIPADNNLGYARQFKYSSANYISLPGTYTLSQNMTVITVLKHEMEHMQAGRFFGSLDTSGMIFSTSQDSDSSTVSWYNGGTWYQSKKRCPANKVTFLAYVLRPSSVSFYVDSKTPSIIPATVNVKTANNLSIGRCWDGNYAFAGNIYYFILIPRALSQVEIEMYYDKLMVGETRNILDIESSLANSLILGKIKTNSSAILTSENIFLVKSLGGSEIRVEGSTHVEYDVDQTYYTIFKGRPEEEAESLGTYTASTPVEATAVKYLIRTTKGIPAGTHSLMDIIQQLVRKSHEHVQHPYNYAYRVNCVCQCSTDN